MKNYTMTQPVANSVKGRRLLPSLLDETGTDTPERIYASWPRTRDLADGFQDVSHGQVLRAADALATWLTERHGVSKDFETLAYAGIGDLRYALFFFAAAKCGYKALFVSPRNPVEQNVSLLEQTKCNKFFYAEEMVNTARGLQQAIGEDLLEVILVAQFDECLDAYTKPYPFTKSFEEAMFDPVVVLHSSGSTGAPKPIIQNHKFFTTNDQVLPSVDGRQNGGSALWDYEGGGYYFTPFPSYHLAGFNSLTTPLFGRSCSLLLGFPDRPATPEMVRCLWRQNTHTNQSAVA